MEPFIEKELIEPNRLQRITKKTPPGNALIELTNYLSKNPISKIDSAVLEEIETKFNLNIKKKFKDDFKEILTQFITHELDVKDIGKDTYLNIKKLSDFLQIEDKSFQDLYLDKSLNKFSELVTASLEKNKPIEETTDTLEIFKQHLHIPKEEYQSIIDKRRFDIVNNYFQEIIKDRRISPEEETDFRDLSKRLQVVVSHDADTEELIRKFRALWETENSDLIELSPDIMLQKSERCYFIQQATWSEFRKDSSRIRYGGVSSRIRISKGLYIRAGDIVYKKESKDELKPIDEGIFYLTNKRIIFSGEKGNRNIRYSRIIDTEVFSDGIGIHKDAGKNVCLLFDKDSELAHTLLNRLIRDSTQ
jgi:hypothetical protein